MEAELLLRQKDYFGDGSFVDMSETTAKAGRLATDII